MNFEDIVDMDWVDTHTTLEDPTEFSSDFFYNHQPDFLLEQPLTPPQQPAAIEPEIKMEPISGMPTTEQIKQLIEIAKRQLALREQNYLLQQQQQQQQVAEQQQPILFQPIAGTAAPSISVTESQIAAPSTIFTMPPLPALSPTTIATSDITAIENGTTLDSISESLSQQLSASAQASIATTGATSTSTTSSIAAVVTATTALQDMRRDSLASMPEESISLEAYAEADGIDLKKLNPKERRQLRNKLSARNFRVRRKEYISTLEGQVNDHKMAAEALKEKLVKIEEENKKLRDEMDTLKRQNQILLARQQQQQQKSPRIMSSPLPKPNLNKDISIMGTKATDSYRQQDNCILVSNAIMPVWDYNAILNNNNKTIKPQQQEQRRQSSNKNNEYMNHLVGQFLVSVVQLACSMPHCRGTNQIKKDEFRLPLMPDDRDFSSSSTTIKSSLSSSSSSSSSLNTSTTTIASTSSSSSSPLSASTTTTSSLSYMEDLYDALIQSALINGSNSDKSFWWWDNQNNTQSQAM